MNLPEEIKKFLEDKLSLSVYLEKDDIRLFFIKMQGYLGNRSSMETFFNNVTETIDFLEKLGFDNLQIINCISSWPSIIHADKKDLLYKYLMLGKLTINQVSGLDRREVMLYHPKDFMTGIDTIFARIEFFLSPAYEEIFRTRNITRRKLFKITHSEFKDSYGVSKDDLLKRYPLTRENLREILEYDINREIVGNFYDNSEDFGKRPS